jgi:hypothetical protein
VCNTGAISAAAHSTKVCPLVALTVRKLNFCVNFE